MRWMLIRRVISRGRETYKDLSPFHLSPERYSPVSHVRRASDSTISMSDINQEFLTLQKNSGIADKAYQAELQKVHSLMWMGGPPALGVASPSYISYQGSPTRCSLSSPTSPLHHLKHQLHARSQTPSPGCPATPPSIPGSPLHTNVDCTALSLSQLQLHSPSMPASPIRSQHQESPPICLSPQIHHIPPSTSLSPASFTFPIQSSVGSTKPLLSPCRTGPTPPPSLPLGIIKEEPQKLSSFYGNPNLSYQLLSNNPQISITNETGDQMFIGSSDSSPDASYEMDTSPYPSPLTPDMPYSFSPQGYFLSKGLSLDSPFPGLPDVVRPSITRGIGIACLQRVQQVDNQNLYRVKNERNLVRQNAFADPTNNKHQMFIASNMELRHSFPPFAPLVTPDGLPTTLQSSTNPLSDSDNNINIISSTSNIRRSLENIHRNIFENELHKTGSGSLLFCVPNKWSRLPVSDIVGAISELVENQAPSLVREGANDGRICLRDPEGAEVQVEVAQGPDSRSLKMRRVSGDDSQYSHLCQQLINCMTT